MPYLYNEIQVGRKQTIPNDNYLGNMDKYLLIY